MSALSDKLKKAREATVTSGPFVFTFRRPTDTEFLRLRASTDQAAVFAFVIGWAKTDGTEVTEVDIGLPNGDPHPLSFDADACRDMLSDNFVLAQPVLEAVYLAYNAHVDALGAATKN